MWESGWQNYAWRGYYPWLSLLFLAAYDKASGHRFLKDVTSLQEVFKKVEFVTETDAASNLSLVSYEDTNEFSMVTRVMNAVAPYTTEGGYIRWVNSHGDSWTSLFEGGEMYLVNEIMAEE